MKLEKVTEQRKRHYDDACGTAHAMDLIGERWAALVVRELLFGPKRFGELRADLPGLSANVLTQRLEGLEESGILQRRRLPPPASAQVYELTSWGYELEPMLLALGRWATRSPLHDPTLPISPTALMLSFKSMYSADRAGDLTATFVIRLGEYSFRLEIAGGAIGVEKAEPDARADAYISAEPAALGAFVYGGAPIDLLAVEGDRALVARLPGLFPLPPKAGS